MVVGASFWLSRANFFFCCLQPLCFVPLSYARTKGDNPTRSSFQNLTTELRVRVGGQLVVATRLIRNFAEYIAKEGGPNDFVEGSVARMRRRFLGFDEKMRESGKTDHQRQPTSPKGLTTTLGQDAKVGLRLWPWRGVDL